MALGTLLEGLLDVLSLPFGSSRPKTRSERIQRVFSVVFWLLFLIATALGLWSYFHGS